MVSNDYLMMGQVMNVFLRGLTVILAAGLFGFTGGFAQESCYDCHGEPDLMTIDESGNEISLYVNQEAYESSIHGQILSCIDCHMDAEGDPHPMELAKVECSICHEDAVTDFNEGLHGQALATGDSLAPNCVSCHGKHDIRSSTDSLSMTFPTNLPVTCGKCHSGDDLSVARNITIAEPVSKFYSGVHGQALLDGNEMAASCNSCHESHKLLPMSNPQSSIYRANISNTCGQCHGDIQDEFDSSSHGVALLRGQFDAPTCNTCHGEHDIKSPTDPQAPTYPEHLAQQICAPCHGIAKLNQKYGLLTDPVESYLDSYHGLASYGGSKVVANCSSCHGVHNILSQANPRSKIHPDNLAQTCGECHINATEAFSQSYVHASPNSKPDIYSAIVKDIYIYLIILVIGGMIVHNFIIYLKFVRIKYRALKGRKSIRRFDNKFIIQHLLIIVSFFTLVITGFALKFHDSTWAQLLSHAGFTEYARGLIHRIAAIVMLGAGVYHLYYLFFDKDGKGELGHLAPRILDVRQFIQNMKFHLGMTRERPDFPRYGYIEKAEYWALVWGTVVMAITGFILWFPTYATFIFPSWIIKVSETIHYYEAWLATLAIVIYHFFFVIFHPEDYPINLAAFTGEITEEEAHEKFPAWYRRVKSKKSDHQSHG
jgi:cytochrome b subunit of formate dehydrogenase